MANVPTKPEQILTIQKTPLVREVQGPYVPLHQHFIYYLSLSLLLPHQFIHSLDALQSKLQYNPPLPRTSAVCGGA